jgi:hypothetical protein
MAMDGFGVREFELVLLRRMADYQPELVEDARAGLGADATTMREANARWQRMLRSRSFPGHLRTLRAALGEPTAVVDQRLGDLTCRSTRWRLPLWPDLLFEALTGPGSALLNSSLIRDPQGPVPVLRGRADLTPWSCVIGDIERCFPPVRHAEGGAPSRWNVRFSVPDARGGPVALVGRFVHGLLQTVDEGVA